jgi:hypothetical protein
VDSAFFVLGDVVFRFPYNLEKKSLVLSMTVHQYDKWLCKTVHDLWWFDLYGQNNQLIVNFILCQGNLNFCSISSGVDCCFMGYSEIAFMVWVYTVLKTMG